MRTDFVLFICTIYCISAMHKHSVRAEKPKACLSKLLSASICKAYRTNALGKIEEKETENRKKHELCLKWTQCANCQKFSVPDDPCPPKSPELIDPIKKPKFIVRILPKGLSEDDETFRGMLMGFIYNENYIVTRARALGVFGAPNLTVVAGDYHRKEVEPTEQKRNITEVIIHEEFNLNTPGVQKDIALLKLTSPLNFNEDVGKAAIGETPGVDKSLRIAYWGNVERENFVSDVFSSIGKSVVTDHEKCRMDWLRLYNITDDYVCAGLAKDGCGLACPGDPTGMLISSDGEFVFALAFLVSDCRPGVPPHVYHKMSLYTDWIASKTDSKKSPCKTIRKHFNKNRSV